MWCTKYGSLGRHGKEGEVGMHIVGLINEVDMGHVVDVV